MNDLLVSMEATLIIYSELEPMNGKQKLNGNLEGAEKSGNKGPPFTSSGIHINEIEDLLHIGQNFNMNMIKRSFNDIEFSKFFSMRIKLT